MGDRKHSNPIPDPPPVTPKPPPAPPPRRAAQCAGHLRVIADLEKWIDDLQSGMWINCVYCGHRYGPDAEKPNATMRKALEAHIAACPKHPLAAAKARIAELEKGLS